MFARWPGATARRIDDSHRILNRHKLLARLLLIDLRSTETRQNERNLPRDQMGAVQLGRDVRGQPAFLYRFRGVFGVGRRGQKVAAHSKEEMNLAIVHLLNRFHRVSAIFVRWSELKLAAEFLHEG